MEEWLEHGGRRFHLMAYDDAFHDDAWAVELAEFVDQELGAALVTFLHYADRETQVLVTDGMLPLAVLTAFIAEVARDQGRR